MVVIQSFTHYIIEFKPTPQTKSPLRAWLSAPFHHEFGGGNSFPKPQ
jgi:hypothetical protein